MIDQLDLDRLRRLGECENRIGAPIDARHTRAVKRHLFLQRSTDRLNDVALDLIAEAVGIDDQPTVMRDVHPRDAHALGREVDLDVDDSSHVRLARVILDEPESASVRSSAAWFALPSPW